MSEILDGGTGTRWIATAEDDHPASAEMDRRVAGVEGARGSLSRDLKEISR
jgi:hypothetical protein